MCSIILIWLVSTPACLVGSAAYICSAMLLKLVVANVVAGLMLAIAIATEILLKKKTLGGGDIKLVFALTLYLGFWESAQMLAAACALAIIYMAAQKRRGRPLWEVIPFGPAIAVAGAAWLLVVTGMMRHLTEKL